MTTTPAQGNPLNDEGHIDVVCLSCFNVLKIPLQYAGKTGHCTHCGEKIEVPHLSALNGQTVKPPPVSKKNNIKAGEAASTIVDEFKEKAEFIIGLLAATGISSVWSLVLFAKAGTAPLFFCMVALSLFLTASSLFFILGRGASARVYTRLGLDEELCHNAPLNTLNIILGILCLTHFVPLGPFLLNSMGFFKTTPTAQSLLLYTVCFGIFPLLFHGFLRRGNLWILSATIIVFASFFVGRYFYISNASGFSTFNIYYFIEIAGSGPFFYWALSGAIYLLSMMALFVCWRSSGA